MADKGGEQRDQIWHFREPALPPFLGAGSNPPTGIGMVEQTW